jgi:RpiR family carbohydrate utilization transcriptional regulator
MLPSRKAKSSRKAEMSTVVDIISRLRAMAGQFRPAEAEVAKTVLDDPFFAGRASIAELAGRAGVSQPSVTRFCRALGCESLRDFKFKLAQNLAVGTNYLKQPERLDDDVAHLSQRVIGCILDGIALARDQLDHQAVRAAIETIAETRRLDIYGVGGASHGVGMDAYFRFFRLDIPCAFYGDSHLQRMSASTLGPGDTVLAICNSGFIREVLESVEIARQYGAKLIAMTKPQTPLARLADVAVLVDVPEDPDIFKPTASRIAQIAVMDVIATGVAVKRGAVVHEKLRRIRHNLIPVHAIAGAPAPRSTEPSIKKSTRRKRSRS